MAEDFDSLLQDSVDILEKSFYQDKFYFSYSSLNKLLWNPAIFYQMYILGLKEERVESHLVQGKIIHALLLEEAKFNEMFVISPANLPTGNLRTVVDRVFSQYMSNKQQYDALGVTDLTQFQDEIVDAMKEMNYHQTLKTDQQRLDKVITAETKSYWEFLKTKGSKILIDQETYDFCVEAVEVVKTNKQLCELIACDVTDFDNKEVYNEEPFQLDLKDKPFGLKGIIDNLVIDHDKKIIFVNDIKTSSKDLKDFPESIEFYSYWLQGIIYTVATSMKYQNLIEAGYQLKFHFVVIDRTYQSYAFPVTEKTMHQWLDRFNEVMTTAEWHYTNKSYELPYQFARGLVAL